MKTENKTTMMSKLAGSAVLSAVMLFALSPRAFADGTDVFHFTDVTFMTNSIGTNSTVIVPGADGFVEVSQKTEGHAEHQSFAIAVSGLETNTPYELLVRIGAATNLTDVGPLTTDRDGDTFVEYADFGLGHGNDKDSDKGDKDRHSQPLPADLKPVVQLSEVDVVNSNAQVVLTADLTDPNRLEYLVQERLKNGKVRGDLFIQATENHTKFRLSATGLATNTPYLLAFNGEVVQTNNSTMKGRLDIHSLAETPPFILDVHSVALWDTASNVVLQTELP